MRTEDFEGFFNFSATASREIERLRLTIDKLQKELQDLKYKYEANAKEPINAKEEV
jgi:hypothetical protein